MKVLIVCSGNKGRISPFIVEQVEALRKLEVVFSFFLIEGKGLYGYFSNIRKMNKVIEQTNPDLIHAHYGLSGLLANMQRTIPVITTFHGSDINFRLNKPFSVLASKLSVHNIYVSQRLARDVNAKDNFSIVPCGIDPEVFFPSDRYISREKMHLEKDGKLILFSGSFTDKVKNYPLAKASVRLLDNVKLIELDGYSREEVNLLMNACDVALMTSFNEGSPQFIKEAMACNTPVVSVDVGDASERISGMEGCYISDRNPGNIANAIAAAIKFGAKTNCRESVLHLNNDVVARNILEIYHKSLNI